MKKLLLGITVLAVLSMLGTTVLAGSSAPKSLCYQWDSYLPLAMMTLKSLGTIKTADGPIKHYAIHGTQLYSGYYIPSAITGTATFTNGILSFNHTTLVRTDGSPGSSPTDSYWQMTAEGTFDTATGTGHVTSALIDIPTSAGTVAVNTFYNVAISAVACQDYSISTSSNNIASSISGMMKMNSIPE